MGDYAHRAIVVMADFAGESLYAAHACAITIMQEPGRPSLVSDIIHANWNHGASFFVAPDGSKIGRPGAEAAAERRERLKKSLAEISGLHWVEVEFGHEGARVTADAVSVLGEEDGCTTGGH